MHDSQQTTYNTLTTIDSFHLVSFMGRNLPPHPPTVRTVTKIPKETNTITSYKAKQSCIIEFCTMSCEFFPQQSSFNKFVFIKVHFFWLVILHYFAYAICTISIYISYNSGLLPLYTIKYEIHPISPFFIKELQLQGINLTHDNTFAGLPLWISICVFCVFAFLMSRSPSTKTGIWC